MLWLLLSLGLLERALVLRWSLVNDCVCASVAHDFSIDLFGKHMLTKSYQKYRRNRRTDAFLGIKGREANIVWLGTMVLQKIKGTGG